MVDQAYIHGMVLSKKLIDRQKAAKLLEYHFSNIHDKDLAWQDFLRLTQDEDLYIRMVASDSIGIVFCQVPDKARAWHDLHKLSEEKDIGIRSRVAKAIGSTFSQVTNREEALRDLSRLTRDEDIDVRINSYHALGRIHVLKAVEAKDRSYLCKELKTAIGFFEKSFQERNWYNPSKFCLLFYRLYFALIFLDARDDEIKMYLAEAKHSAGLSKSSAELLVAVENLAKALWESKKLKSKSLEEMANELSAFRWYCDEAAEHMTSAEESASWSG